MKKAFLLVELVAGSDCGHRVEEFEPKGLEKVKLTGENYSMEGKI